MQMNDKVLTALEVLKDCAENELDKLIIERCERDLIQPPKVEIIDEVTQEFLGTKYHKKKGGHYFNDFSVHRAIFSYYHGSIPNSLDIHHKDMDKANNDILNLELLTKSGHHKKHWEGEGTVKLICAECGKEFFAHRRIKKGTNAFCSKECGDKFRTKVANRTHEKKICKNCGKEFQGRKDIDVQFCSQKCHYQFIKKTHVKLRKCKYCGKEFVAKRKSQIYCCDDCQHKSQRVDKKAICEYCGKEFFSDKYLTQKFCSKECVLNARKNSIPSIEKICPVCGQKFLAKSQLKIYCSRSCVRKASHHSKK